jgi:hypothetical protein
MTFLRGLAYNLLKKAYNLLKAIKTNIVFLIKILFRLKETLPIVLLDIQ